MTTLHSKSSAAKEEEVKHQLIASCTSLLLRLLSPMFFIVFLFQNRRDKEDTPWMFIILYFLSVCDRISSVRIVFFNVFGMTLDLDSFSFFFLPIDFLNHFLNRV